MVQAYSAEIPVGTSAQLLTRKIIVRPFWDRIWTFQSQEIVLVAVQNCQNERNTDFFFNNPWFRCVPLTLTTLNRNKWAQNGRFGGGSRSSIGLQSDIHARNFVDPNASKSQKKSRAERFSHRKWSKLGLFLLNFGPKFFIALKHCSQNLIHFGFCNQYDFLFGWAAVLGQTKLGS